MDSRPPELNFDFKPTYVPKTISDFLKELSMIGNISERLSKLEDYIKRLEEEMRKIDAFKRELPLCMLLLNDAIVVLKEEAMQCTTSDLRPVMEEFIPLKRNSDEDGGVEKENDSRDKKTWMSSAQLWSSDVHSSRNINYDREQKSVVEIKERVKEDDLVAIATRDPFQPCKYKNGGGAFMPFNQCSGFPATARKEDKEVVPASGLSLLTPGPRDEPGSSCLNSKTSDSNRAVLSSSTTVQSNLRTTAQQQQQQKQRRCWSLELHRRFVNALQQLGGSQATPKQIRELMHVDGLTNDEVKSHLQKYRLHTRRFPAAAASTANKSVVLGGLWVPHDQYGDSSKPSSSQSGSPQGPLQLARTGGGIFNTGGDSIEYEDGKSESYSWKGHLHKSGKDNVHIDPP
ncbi:hypothetical protein HHK36_008440 [Tetracentron sinense]|uniref:HTH myb-type domain-containing protein n=1 Tax=Tetracentron sinense TaxID=13715 RepID=A0A835DJC1_TETSI|nr:hypothetical protein HHK36_008440 [Tetracentron sinense]